MKTILIDAVYTFVIVDGDGYKVFDEMKQMLENFPNRKIILTGANAEQSKVFGLNKMPYEVFTLSNNPKKSDPRYFKTMLKHFDLKPENVLYFEHSEEAAKSAESVGIKTYHYDPVKKDLQALQAFLEANLE